MSVFKSLTHCQCTIPIKDSFKLSRSPLDSFGYKAKCCGCVPLKAAVVIIGLITLIWAALQIQSADKAIAEIISDKNTILFFYLKLSYMCTSALLLVACGVLFLGIALTKFNIINIFVWYGFIFNILSIATNMASFVLKIMNTENKLLKHIVKFTISLFWNFLFFYFLVIVNSFKIMTVWS